MATEPTSTTPARTPPPTFSLKYPPVLEPFNRPAATWLTTHDKHWDGLLTGALVFSPENRVLLLQRASHDSMPNRWETPGGAADAEDASLFVSCARELWEEAGLEAVEIVRIVTEGRDMEPGSVFPNRNGTRLYCRFGFEVRVKEGGVKIDPEEHQDFLWATEEEVNEEKVGEREIPITNGQMKRLILDGFRRRREEVAEGADEVVEGR
ncbi:hypothetical protein C8034_v004264 [Colletotrichum sidae]|uniref:Nudix hydrolase domain-containing protein n=1 Tax=Colletotrichum sidae TaxID=1347389 RepID=A0A4R8TPX4_9PEZI|nr:hypothetical protein C8034_v004264 [Colletotrichum sidae]